MERNTNPLYILRFIAAIMVVWLHFGPNRNFFTTNGGEAVTFFFFLSGFVMIIANSKYLTGKNLNFSKTDFYIKRFARIYPMYFLALLLLAIFHYFIQSIDTPTVKYRLIFETLGIQGWLYPGSFNFPAWTVSCEFFFYLLFPAAIVYLKSNKAKFKTFAWVYFILTYAITLGLYFLNSHKKITIIYALTWSPHPHPVLVISIFFLGMLCGSTFINNNLSFFKNKTYSTLTALITISAIFFIKYYLPSYLLNCGLLTPLFFVFILAITSFSKKDSAFFNFKLFIFLGDISYSIYIFQLPVLHYYNHYISPTKTWPSVICFTLTLIAFCSIIYYTVELPLKNYILAHFNKRKALKEKDLAIL